MERTMKITGKGHIRLAPDQTLINLTLRSTDKEYAAAMEKASSALEKLQTALKNCGFEPEDMKTAAFQVDTNYESVCDERGVYRSVFAGYSCIHEMKLAFDLDMRRLSSVLRAISSSVAEPELGINFTVRDREAAEKALLEDAAKNAHKKAEILAGASGVRLGELLSVDYSWGEIDILSPTAYRMEAKCAVMDGAANMDLAPEDVDLSENVTFVWSIK